MMKEECGSVQRFPPRLARQALHAYLHEHRTITPPADTPAPYRRRAGVFVTLHKDGHLRGCIGTFAPQQNSIAEEIIRNAISSATRDPRFPPVQAGELPSIHISVDILSTPEKVSSIDELDPQRFGVIVSRGWQRGLLLPALPGVNTAAEQLEIACQKAGLRRTARKEITIERFEVTRCEEGK